MAMRAVNLAGPVHRLGPAADCRGLSFTVPWSTGQTLEVGQTLRAVSSAGFYEGTVTNIGLVQPQGDELVCGVSMRVEKFTPAAQLKSVPHFGLTP